MSSLVPGGAKAKPPAPLRAPEVRVSTWTDPLAGLRAEHARLLEAANQIDWLLGQRSLSASERLELDVAMRGVRALLPTHLVKEEFTLYPEIRGADPVAGLALPELKRKHLLVEDDFAELQAVVLALDVGEVPTSLRRKAARAARAFRDDLSSLVADEEGEAFAAAQRGLSAEAFARLKDAFEAADMKEALKRDQQR